jgi:bacterioferritin-associated ferredoxin
MTRNRVDRCVCHERTFAELLAVARRTGATSLAELELQTDFGRGCGTCRPYVELVLTTGRTSLPVLPAVQAGPEE